MPKRIATDHVRSLYKRLFSQYGQQHWWPARSRWEMMVGAILTQNTSWTNVEKAILALRKAKALTAEAITRLPRKRLEKLIRSSGYFRQKARRLQSFANAYLAKPSIARNRDALLAQHGVGPETADCILLYASKIPSFVVDAYTRRIGERMGWFKQATYQEVQQFFEDRLPRQERLYNEYHALIVQHAKQFCRRNDPRCAECPTRDMCRHGKRKAA